MGINIDNDEAARLVGEVAARTGKSPADVVIEAMRERLRRLESGSREGMAEKLMEIAKRTAPHMRGAPRHGDLLYDEVGLPK